MTIEWTDRSWNPVRGCARVSPGCERCYAERQAHRFSAARHSGKPQPYEGLTVLGKHGPRWAGQARFIPEMLSRPLKWRSPLRVFVNSMADLFHDDITDEQIAAVFGVMAACPQHTFQLLTKRPERMREWFAWHQRECRARDGWLYERWRLCEGAALEILGNGLPAIGCQSTWPLQNVWLGVSCEDQPRADERIPLLLEIPAVVRFVSAEPLLGPVDLHYSAFNGADSLSSMEGIGWLIAGGESGPSARRCYVSWIRAIVRQCEAARVPCFVKQLGARPYDDRGPLDVDDRKGAVLEEFPADLRVREFPGAPMGSTSRLADEVQP